MQPETGSMPPQGAGDYSSVGVACMAAPFGDPDTLELDTFLCDVIALELKARFQGSIPVDVLDVADPEVHAAGRLVFMGQIWREVVTTDSGDKQVMYAIGLTTYRHDRVPDRPVQPFPRIVAESPDDDYDALRKKVDAAVADMIAELRF